MRVAVIGCGSIGCRHIQNLLALGCDVYGYDPDYRAVRAKMADTAARIFGVLGWDETFDALVVATPMGLHRDGVEEAIRRGIPSFVEKPLGPLDQLNDWHRIVKATQRAVTQIGYQLRFHPHALALKNLKPHGGILTVEADSRTWPGAAYGHFLLEFSHEIDLALFLGAPDVVTGATMSDHSAAVRLGAHWHLNLVDHAPRYWRRWAVFNATYGSDAIFTSPEELGDEMYRAELVHFLDCVRDGIPTQVPFADGLRVLNVCQQVEALSASSASSKPV